jgi:hypothetical protein
MDNPFESSDVVEVVGIRPIYLNKFVERRLYGIEPSFRSGEGRGSRRWFSLDDVLGIALVWWLFESGLRTEVIKRVLREVSKSSKDDANLTAKSLMKSGAECLVITRDLRQAGNKQQRTPQVAQGADFLDAQEQLSEIGDESIYVLPVRSLFADLLARLKNQVKTFSTRR